MKRLLILTVLAVSSRRFPSTPFFPSLPGEFQSSHEFLEAFWGAFVRTPGSNLLEIDIASKRNLDGGFEILSVFPMQKCRESVPTGIRWRKEKDFVSFDFQLNGTNFIVPPDGEWAGRKLYVQTNSGMKVLICSSLEANCCHRGIEFSLSAGRLKNKIEVNRLIQTASVN